jgi:hypothetical protein
MLKEKTRKMVHQKKRMLMDQEKKQVLVDKNLTPEKFRQD